MTKKVFVVDVKVIVDEKAYIRANSEEEAKEKVKAYNEWLDNEEVEEPVERPVSSCHTIRKFKLGSVKEADLQDLINQIFEDC